jgi:hypothetical protein
MVSERLGLPFSIAPLGFALIFVAVVVAAKLYLVPGATTFLNYKARYKREVVSEIFRIVVPTAEYHPFKGIAQAVFREPGIFNTRGGFASDDRVRGWIGETPFEAADVHSTYQTGTGKNSRTHVVFKGLFFHLDFNKALRGTTIVQPQLLGSSQPGDRAGMEVVSFDHPAFEKEFKVYTTDVAEARDLLTPSMMERLLAVRGHARHPVFLAFKNTRAYLGIHYDRQLFEPRVASTTSLDAVQKVADHFALAETIVHELDLNTRIWKGVDESLLEQPDDPTDPYKDALTTGELDSDDVWKLAVRATSEEVDDHSTAPQPADSKIRVERLGDETRINYGLSIGFFITAALSLALLALAALSARALDREYGPTPATAWLERLPPTAADERIGEGAMVILPVSFLVSAFFSMWWLLRVRRVVIRPDAVLISRGLRPMPRRYSRPEYGRVVRVDKAVYVGKVGSTGLMNPSASPILRSEDEAKWIAAEMRRALRQTSR